MKEEQGAVLFWAVVSVKITLATYIQAQPTSFYGLLSPDTESRWCVALR